MKPLALTESVRLPEERAVQRHFDDANWRFWRWIVTLAVGGSAVGLGVTLSNGSTVAAIAWAVDLGVSAALLLVRRTAWLERTFRVVLIGHFLLQLVVLLTVSPVAEFSYALSGYIAPFVLLRLRLRTAELAGLLAISLGLAVATSLGFGASSAPSTGMQIGMSIGATVWALLVLWLGNRITAGVRRRFLAEWRREVARFREQDRMREELHDARQIQLSMLPRHTPNLGWLDLASASLPASEVGGDYFDFVVLDPERLAIVVGDVAGHGMASGLVLASIRGGIHLLHSDLATPAVALGRLDRMVREIAPGRMYVTLQIAVVDHRARRLRLVSAGHPPALVYRAELEEVREIGGPATPLGT
ncbi:MAG: SpoIIE family protein phosphatase, partial [Thermoanaerobaculia bacterium]|nr:SpoIIE family protein phosphatase [Thermoanaerobaculia bacterium]